MVRIQSRSIGDLIEIAKKVLQDSLVTRMESIEYDISTDTYKLDGYSSTDPRIFEIVSIEGLGNDGNWQFNEDLTEGPSNNYQLWDDYTSPEIVEDGYGESSGNQVYTGIQLASSLFEDGSTFHVQYRYQNPDLQPELTNFANVSTLTLLFNSLIANDHLTVTELAETIESFGINSSGENLERLASIVGIEKTVASPTTGKVKVTNNSGSSYSVTTGHRFGALANDGFVLFKPISSGSVADGSSSFFDVEAVEAGTRGNVGSYSITYLFINSNLDEETLDVTVSNPPRDAGGDPNYFTNGTDDETAKSLRKRTQLAFQSVKSASFSPLEEAAIDTGLISDAVAHDQTTKKGLDPYVSLIYAISPSGVLLSPTDLSQIQSAVDEVKPIGSRVTVRQVMNTYVTGDFTIYVPSEVISDTSEIETELDTDLSDWIDTRGIGIDIVPSTLLSIGRGIENVDDMSINFLTITEFVSEVTTLDGQIDLISSGTEQNKLALEMPFNSAVKKEVTTYDGIDAFLDVANTPIDERIDPKVNKEVTNHLNESVPSPSNVTDFFSSVTNSATRILYNTTEDQNDPIVAGDDLLVDYNYYNDSLIDGVRIRLGGDNGNQVRVQLYTGEAADLSDLSAVAGTQVDITLDGTEKVYEAEFSSQANLDPDLNTYWIVIEDISGTGNSYVPTNSDFAFIPFNPDMKVDGQDESSPASPDGSYELIYRRAIYESYTKLTGSSAYDKIDIPKSSFEPERAFTRDLTFTFETYEDD